MIRQLVDGQQKAEVGVLLLGGRHLFDLLQGLDDDVDGVRVGAGTGAVGQFALDADQFDEFCFQDVKVEQVVVEVGQGGEGLDELQDVVPLPVQDQLTQEQQVVRVVS